MAGRGGVVGGADERGGAWRAEEGVAAILEHNGAPQHALRFPPRVARLAAPATAARVETLAWEIM